jgi:methyl-accepting chemotaxis protein
MPQALSVSVLAGVSAWQMKQLADNSAYFAENLVPSYEKEHKIALGLSDIRRLQLQHVAASNITDLNKFESEIAQSVKGVG